MTQSEKASPLIPLGHISAAHGIKGDVLIKTYTEAPENIAAYGPLRAVRDGSGGAGNDADADADAGVRQITLKIIRISNKGVIACIDGVRDRNAAEALRGLKLCIPRDKLPEPEEDEWYYSDLIGLDVYDADGARLGKVLNMHNFGAGDLLELKRDGAKDSDLIAFNTGTVPEVDVKAGRMTLALPAEVSGEAPADSTERNSGDDAGAGTGAGKVPNADGKEDSANE